MPIKRPWNSPDLEIQLEFIKKYSKLLERAKLLEIILLFYDPVHQLHNTIAKKCWQEKWKEWTLILNSNTWRKRYTLMSAINPVTLEYISHNIDWMCNREETIKALEKIRSHYPWDKEIVMINDNARYQKSKEVLERAKELNIIIEYLPPYCPNLNLIERVHKFFKKQISNQYFPTFKLFVEAIDSISNNFSKYKNDIETLLSQKFQVFGRF